LFRTLCRRSILALALIAGVSACASTGMPAYEAPPSLTANQGLKVPTLMPRQPAQMPVDVIALRDSYFAANPDKEFLELDGYSLRGYRFTRTDTVFSDGGTSFHDMNTETYVTSVEGNKICLAPVNNWSGVCLELFKTDNGRLKLYYKYGNGAKGKFIVKNIRV